MLLLWHYILHFLKDPSKTVISLQWTIMHSPSVSVVEGFNWVFCVCVISRRDTVSFLFFILTSFCTFNVHYTVLLLSVSVTVIPCTILTTSKDYFKFILRSFNVFGILFFSAKSFLIWYLLEYHLILHFTFIQSLHIDNLFIISRKCSFILSFYFYIMYIF